jgi:hypothetical protein
MELRLAEDMIPQAIEQENMVVWFLPPQSAAQHLQNKHQVMYFPTIDPQTPSPKPILSN